MMAGDSKDTMSSQVLIESSSFEYIQGPVKKATRLKYNCMSVSPKLVALGSNSGGVYLFSRVEEKLVQVAFAEKETNAVTMVQLSPNEKFVGFVTSSGAVHVLELKLETKSKPETLRSISDLGGATVTCLYWDVTSTKLYFGDDLGRVSLIPVSSNKAKNLFSLPQEVILKLDSAIVQIDKAEEKLLVSTMTRCYLCNTTKHNYSQIGKKLRDGRYGACFLAQGSVTPMIYCARPGSRIWEVDFNGSVLNTHQFKQLLAIPPVSLFKPHGEYTCPEEGVFPGQAVNFPKLQVLSTNFLLSWNSTTLYVLDTVNVSVILWSKPFSGILDVICLGNQIFIFLQTMEVANIAILPVSEVIPLCLSTKNLMAAAKLCLAYKSVLHHKCVRKKLGIKELYGIYDSLVAEDIHKFSEEFHSMVEDVESRTAADADSSDSNRSRSSSVISHLSTTDVLVSDILKHTGETNNKVDELNDAFPDPSAASWKNLDLDVSAENEVENGDNDDYYDDDGEEPEQRLDETDGKLSERNSKILRDKMDLVIHGHATEKRDSNISDRKKESLDIEGDNMDKFDDIKINSVETDVVNGDMLTDNIEMVGVIPGNSVSQTDPQTSITHGNRHQENYTSDEGIENLLTDSGVINETNGITNVSIESDSINKTVFAEDWRDSGISESQDLLLPDDKNAADRPTDLSLSFKMKASDSQSTSPYPASNELVEEEDEEIGALQSLHAGSRRHSLTSLSSLSSAEIFIDQQQTNTGSTNIDEPIAMAVKKRSSRKKRRQVSLDESGDIKEKPGSMLSPTGSLQEPIEENHTLVSQEYSEVQSLQSEEDLLSNTDQHSLKNPDTISISSVLSNSGEYGQSGNEIFKSEELSQSTDFSPIGSPMMESSESGSLERSGSSFPSGSKAKFLKMKDKMQTKVTAKTKNLIKNIKEKNLLTKAKELAENISQVSDNVLSLGEGLYVEPVDANTIRYDTDDKKTGPPSSAKQQQHLAEERDSVAQCLVDIEKLQAKTDKTQAKLHDINTLMNPDAVQMILFDWVTVLNETFQDLHVRKYTQSSPDEPELNANPDSKDDLCPNEEGAVSDRNESVSEKEITAETNGNIKLSRAYSVGKDNDCCSSVLSDKNFCYPKDPLYLKPELYKDVCDLTQACFDVNIHGNILNYRNLVGCIARKRSTPASVSEDQTRSDEATLEVSVSARCYNCDMSGKDSNEDCDKTDSEHTYVKCNEDEHLEECTKVPSDHDTEFNHELIKHKTVGEDIEIKAYPSDLATKNQVKSKNMGVVNESELIDPFDKDEFEDKEKRDDDKDNNKPDSVRGDESLEDSDCAMGFFVRCYFPYLTLSKVRDRLLSDKHSFQTWCAFASCLQVLVLNDNEKYGIQKGSVIDHLLETHYHSDNGSLLLGHISKLFKDSDSAVVYSCCKCHPHVQPVDVLYMCRMHGVALETVFKQYMLLMVQQVSRTLRADTERSVFSHFEVRCVWLELLLSEEESLDLLIDSTGKPRQFAHKHQWKNQLNIEKVLMVKCSTAEAERLLKICAKFGYWLGVLKLTKQLCYRTEQRDSILHLGDVELISSQSHIGYLPSTVDEWETLLADYLNLSSSSDYTLQQNEPSTLTVTSLSLLLVKHLGPDEALGLIDKLKIPEGTLGPEFYQSCLLAGMVQKHQKVVLHSMLEKVDSYLWSQRPTTLSPQLHYLVAKEKEIPDGKADASLQDEIQTLTSHLKENGSTEPYIEDPDCDWGVETRINLQCPCCNIALKEPVSHEESGVLLFRCGHSYHKFCLPERVCLLCE